MRSGAANASPKLPRDYTILDNVHGHGAYIGTYLALTALESRWWGEGEVKMYIDGDEQYPTWCSTGAEDYFGGAWSFADFDEHGRMRENTFTGPYLDSRSIRSVLPRTAKATTGM